MTDLELKETRSLRGTIRAPPSKAYTHRTLIAASLSQGVSKITDVLVSDDTSATMDACRMIGAQIEETDEKTYKIQGIDKPLTPEDIIDCRDSGSTMRFLTPICALADGISVLTGGESLKKRPMELLLDTLRQLGVRCISTKMNGYPPLVVFGGGIKGGKASIQGDVSSQFISGLLFATPKAESDTDIFLSTPLESKPYVNITVDTLTKHKIKIEIEDEYNQFHVPHGQDYAPFDHVIEGDYSSAAFLLAAAAVTNSPVKITNLRRSTCQGDRKIINILQKMGVTPNIENDAVELKDADQQLEPIVADLHDSPDLVPICVVLACLAYGQSVIKGVQRLRFKESDRIEALTSEMTKMGAEIKVAGDSLHVFGGKKLHGTRLDSHGDHRIAMTLAVAALRAQGRTIIQHIECINKSYPDFVTNIRSLGADVLEQ